MHIDQPPKPKVLFHSEVPLEFNGKKILLSFFLIDREESTDGREYIGFDFNTKKEVVPSISFSGTVVGSRSYLSHAEILPATYRGEGLGKLVLSLLEEQLTKNGVRNSFAKFRNIATLRFFLRNGYSFIEQEDMTEEILGESRCNAYSTSILKEFFEKGDQKTLGQELDVQSALLVKELSQTQSTV